MVAYRTASGELHVLDAYCRHLGAHMGYGGTVADGCLACPYHGWEWDGYGRNVRIPFHDRPNRALRMRTWEVRERHGIAYIWHDRSGQSPAWELPDIFQDVFPEQNAQADAFYDSWPSGAEVYPGLSIAPQFVTENAVDPTHFAFVHGNSEAPTVLAQRVADSTFETRMGFYKRGDGWLAELFVLLSGVGLAFTGLRATEPNRLHLGTTPVDEESADLFQTIFIPCQPGDRSGPIPDHLEQYRAGAMAQLGHDINIWKHQRYVKTPGLAADEVRGFNLLRQWTTQFYPAEVGVPA
jgi:nitrite reductase/ring-hydroxylating ferredoxin subunit